MTGLEGNRHSAAVGYSDTRRPAVSLRFHGLSVGRVVPSRVSWFLSKSHAGPEDCAPSASRRRWRTRSAMPVIRIRYLAVMFGGATAGIAGAYLSTGADADVGGRHDRRQGLDRAGAGGVWDLEAACAWSCGAYLFGGVTVLQLYAQGFGLAHPVRIAVDVALRGDHRRSGHHLPRPENHFVESTGVAGEQFPSRRLTPFGRPTCATMHQVHFLRTAHCMQFLVVLNTF